MLAARAEAGIGPSRIHDPGIAAPDARGIGGLRTQDARVMRDLAGEKGLDRSVVLAALVRL